MEGEFRELRNLAKKIDDNVKTLEKIWETPHLISGGYGEKFGNNEQYVEPLFDDIKNVQDQLMKDRESQQLQISRTEEYLKNVEKFYQGMKDQCKDLEDMFSEYGYKPLNTSECLSVEDSKNEISGVESSILSLEEMEDLVIRSPIPLRPNDNETERLTAPTIQQKSIATPVITSLASARKLQALKQSNMGTNLENSGIEYYSPYYGRRLK